MARWLLSSCYVYTCASVCVRTNRLDRDARFRGLHCSFGVASDDPSWDRTFGQRPTDEHGNELGTDGNTRCRCWWREMETDDRFWDSQCKAIDDQEKLAARARRTFAQVCHTPFERENHGMELRLIGILATLADLKERATNEHVLQDNTLCHIARAAVDQVNGEDLKLCDWQLLFCPRCREVGMRVDRILTDMAERMARLEDQLNDGIFNLAVTPMETATIDAVGVQETKMKIVMRQIKDVPFIQQNSKIMLFAEKTFEDAKNTLVMDLQTALAQHCNRPPRVSAPWSRQRRERDED